MNKLIKHPVVDGAILTAGILLVVLAFIIKINTGDSADTVQGTYEDSDEMFQAEITKDNIEVYAIGDDTKSLYWKGTWTTGKRITSQGDLEAMDASLLGSGATTKVFEVEGDRIAFDFSIMGTTQTIVLKKVD